MIDEKKILKRLSEIEAHNKIINDLATQLRKDLGYVHTPAPKRGLPDSEKAILKRKFYKAK